MAVKLCKTNFRRLKRSTAMAQLTPLTQAVLSLIQSTANQAPPQLLSFVNTGDLLSLVVRSNPSDGPGTLFFNGQMLKAALPPQLTPGDTVLATLTQQNNQLILNLVDVVRAAQSPGKEFAENAALITRQTAGQELAELLRSITILDEPQAPPPSGTSSLLHPMLQQELQDLLPAVLSMSELLQGETTEAKLPLLSGKNAVKALRLAAKELRDLAEETTAPKLPLKLLNFLESEIQALLARAESSAGPKEDLQVLRKLIVALEQEADRTSPKQKEVLRSMLSELRSLEQNPEQLRTKLEQLLQKYQPAATGSEEGKQTENKLNQELKTLAGRLEQLASAQEALNRLNPIMQALGEPALIVFPFLFHGLLGQAEAVVERPRKVPEDKKDKKGGKEGQEGFQQVHLSVPLPSLGLVNADIAYSKKEMLVRFTVEDEEACDFLIEQLDKLKETLRDHGFALTECSAAIGPTKAAAPAWSAGIYSDPSVIA